MLNLDVWRCSCRHMLHKHAIILMPGSVVVLEQKCDRCGAINTLRCEAGMPERETTQRLAVV